VQKCLMCKMTPGRAFSDTDIPPYGATMFTSPGHYGSTAWDPFNSDLLQVTICDDCLVANMADVLVRKDVTPKVVKFEYEPWQPGQD
jgi:hypothetical protein